MENSSKTAFTLGDITLIPSEDVIFTPENLKAFSESMERAVIRNKISHAKSIISARQCVFINSYDPQIK